MRGEEGRALGIIEGRGQRRELRRRDHDFIGVAAMPQLDDDLVADARAVRRVIDLGNIAGGLHARA